MQVCTWCMYMAFVNLEKGYMINTKEQFGGLEIEDGLCAQGGEAWLQTITMAV